jgi:hypothetical protein
MFYLHDMNTAERIRLATIGETKASRETGTIDVDGRACYVVRDDTPVVAESLATIDEWMGR